MNKTKSLPYFLICLVLSSCMSSRPFYNKKEKDWESKILPESPVKYSVYLLGILSADDSAHEVLKMLHHQVENSDSNHTLVFIGDPFSDSSTTKQNGENNSTLHANMDAQLDLVKDDNGKIVFIPGHHNEEDKSNGDKEANKKYIERKLGRENIFLPEDDCPGSSEIKLTDDLIIIPLNTSIWAQDKFSKRNSCDVKSESGWLDDFKDVVDNNQRKNILILGYHPLFSLGNYGGFFSWKQHIFPLTDWQRNLYLPLPVIGSVYLILRSGIGFKNDFAFPPYKKFRKSVLAAIRDYGNVVYASGHERNIQFFKYNKQDFIVTNSSPSTSWVAGKNKAYFTDEASGLVKLSYLKNGEVWMEVFIPDGKNEAGKVIYRKRLKDNVYGEPGDTTLIVSSAQIADSSVLIAADPNLKAGKFKELFLGKHYRGAWTAPVRVPVLDLRTEHGGLEIIKKGGGFQTKSLQLKNAKGEEYSLRSVVKYPEKLLGNVMLHTFAADIVKDQMSSTHPYSPYVLDDLSEAASILHSNPKMVFIPKDKLLAEYRKDFANTLALFEQRADGKLRPEENFGYATESVSSSKMFEHIHEDNANAVDDYRFLKSRLFDMWINDWDRHEGQWRWGEIDCDSATVEHCKLLKAKSKYYIPIPKDRDQAFAKFDGVLGWIAGRKWLVRKFQDFKNDIRDVPGLNYNARNLDHALLTELSKKDWMRIAEELKLELTDKKIEHAIRQFPDTIYKLDGAEIIGKLKSRRDKLPSFAERYYDYLAQYVDVVGSDKKETFNVVRINDDSTSVKVFDNSGSGERLIYSRTFFTKETKEIRLYGLGDDDVFHITGKVKKGIMIRVIGGKGLDTISDESAVKGWRKKTRVYDDKEKNVLQLGSEAKDLTSTLKTINDYDFYANDYNILAPAIFFGYNVDDGIFLGGGAMTRYHSFRKAPYANYQRIVANVAISDLSFNFRYTGDFNDVFGKWGINVDASVIAPKGTMNFYGLGNDTRKTVASESYYRLRYDDVTLFPSLKKHFGKYQALKIGPHYEYVRIVNNADRFIGSSDAKQYIQDYSSRSFGGIKVEYEFQKIDDSLLTTRGIKWLIGIVDQNEFKRKNLQSANLESQLCFFIPLRPGSTLALRGGAATRLGNFEFYQANTLGGMTVKRDNGNLRGYVRGRYSGRSMAYLNTDLRIKLFGFRTYLFPAHFGILAFYDEGRVWNDHEISATWHTGYGGGVWLDPFGMAVVNFSYAVSKEDKLFNVSLGFLF